MDEDPAARPWVVPETPAEPAPPTLTRSVAAAPAPPDRTAPAGIHLPIPFRPLTAIDILDGAVGTIKSSPRTVLGITALFVVPVELVIAWVNRSTYGRVSFGDTLEEGFIVGSQASLGEASNVVWALALLQLFILPFVGGALGPVIASWYTGRVVTAGGALRAVLRRTPALVVAFVVIHLAEFGAALTLIFPGIMLMTLWVVTAPAIVIEGLGPFAGMARSSRLTRRRYWPCMGVALSIFVVNLVLSAGLGALSLLLLEFKWGWIADVMVGSGAALVTTVLATAGAVLLYLDLRIRTEGLDIELEADSSFDRAA
jgi:hypothetical protein